MADSTYAVFPKLFADLPVASLKYELEEEGINHLYSARLTAKEDNEILAIVREITI